MPAHFISNSNVENPKRWDSQAINEFAIYFGMNRANNWNAMQLIV